MRGKGLEVVDDPIVLTLGLGAQAPTEETAADVVLSDFEGADGREMG